MSGLSLSDIAKALNVAPSTISRAMTRPDKVAPQTRKKILDYINQVGFKPNLTARNLRKKCTYTIGIVVNDLGDRVIARAANVIQNEVAKRGFFPIVLSTEDSSTKERELISQLFSLNVSGLVVIPSSATHNILQEYPQLPVVELDRSTSTQSRDEFRMDDLAAMQLATNYLYEQGCRNIVVALGNVDLVSSFQNRWLALDKCHSECRYFPFSLSAVKADELVEEALDLTLALLMTQPHYQKHRLGLEQEQRIKERFFEFESVLLDLERLMSVNLCNTAANEQPEDSSHDYWQPVGLEHFANGQIPIDAILATNNSLATGVLQACYTLGFKPQQDIKIFSFDNPEWLKVLPFKIPSLTHPLDQAAYLAINRLLDLVEHKHKGEVEVTLIRPELVV